MIILGLRSDVLKGPLPWHCLSCFTCLDRCPQGGDVGEAMFTIRNLAVAEGNTPKGILVQAQSLFETGRVVTPSKMALTNRKKYGLGKQPAVDIKDVQKILRKTSFDELIYRGSQSK